MNLRLKDTLSGEQTEVRHRPGRPVALYVCGPTVYDSAHVGHARTYLYFDVIRRNLLAEGTPVRHVMNVTDIEDKIDRRAAALGTTWRRLARREEGRFFRDLDSIGALRPNERPRASDFLPQIIALARRLERTGRVHRKGDEWIYSPPARRRRENFPTGVELARHAVREPHHPFPVRDGASGEFMVWKRQEPPSASWPSPWGAGTPGWHLECFAIAERYLGLPVDLHGGGVDLIYPHHHAENEIALTLRGKPFSRVFLHTAFVLQSGTKMSKSKGNLISVRAALQLASAGALRWYLIGPRYNDRLEWDPRGLERAEQAYQRVRRTFQSWLTAGAGGTIGASAARALAARVRHDLVDNLSTDSALERILGFVSRLERDPSGRVAPGERRAARAALGSVETRTGLPLL